jgi:NitT/TauT family transport system substrate-binding protein
MTSLLAHRTARRTFLTLAATAPLAIPGIARAADTVLVGTTNSASDAPFFIATERGFFHDANLDVTLQAFDSAAKMVVPLGAGQLDAGGGAPSAGLFNAFTRGIDVKIVAPKSSSPPGYGYVAIVVRKALVDSGRFKTFADLKGMTAGEPGQGSTSLVSLESGLRRGGLSVKDIHEVFLGFPDQMAAFANGSIDVSALVEPFVTRGVEQGLFVKIAGSDQLEPNVMNAALLYGGAFGKGRSDVAQRFMIAYLKAARFYNDALKGGHLAGRTANDVIPILTKYTAIKDPAVFRKIVPNGLDPDGKINLESLANDARVFQEAGLTSGEISASAVVDTRFVDAALKTLGPYKPNR